VAVGARGGTGVAVALGVRTRAAIDVHIRAARRYRR